MLTTGPHVAAAALMAATLGAAGLTGQPAQPRQGSATLAVFRAPGFPTVDAAPIDPAVLDAALADLPVVTFDSAAALSEGLSRQTGGVLLLPYGSAFPVDAWSAIRAFVKGGGGLVVLGGAPFAVPVRQVNGTAGAATYVQDRRQPTFSHEFLIGPAEPVERRDILSPTRVEAVRGSEWNRLPAEPARAFAITIRLATIKDFKDEGGSEGFRDAVIRPLVHVVDRDGIPRAAPLIAIDRLRGGDAGARWILAPSDAALDAPTIHDLAVRALEGAVASDARPVRASIERGATPMLRINVQRPVPREGEAAAAAARVRVTNKDGADVWTGNVPLNGPAEFRTGLASIGGDATLAPG
ncbi:MAG TPA: hypothetical protein VFK20_05225, partial [Vicinamibacterales bacterium]|nr:hypothetical protein [Vicinamibacterales bacterium]